MKKSIITVITIWLISLSGSAATLPANDKMSINRNNMLWVEAVNSGSTSELVNLYTNDAIIMAPSLEIFSTRKDIEDFWFSTVNTIASDFRIETINLRVEGDTVYQTAVWIATVTSNGKSNEIDGEMTNVLRRQNDGTWKISLQSWN